MANLLDNAINQHLQNFKANAANSVMMLGRPQAPPPPNHVPASLPPFSMPGGYGVPIVPGGPPPTLGAPSQLPQSSIGLAGGGNTPGQGMLSVAIDNLPFRYRLSENDLRECFQQWGPLQSVQVNRD